MVASFRAAAVWWLTVPALAQETPAPEPDRSTASKPDYLDDRSSPESVVRSLYNAVNRREYVRAYAYFRDEPDRPPFAAFAKGYADTARVDVKLGSERSEGAAGSIYYALPVAIRSRATDGETSVFSGCYELRLVQPGVQAEPPFQPLGIVRGRLLRSGKSFDETVGACPADGLE